MRETGEVEKSIKELLDDNSVTGYQIQKEYGIDQSVISKLRNKERELNRLTWESIKKLYTASKELH